MAIPDLDLTYELSFQSRAGFGRLTAIFKEARDRVLLPFPCFQSDIPLYGANSGGPVFDKKGRICAVNCTNFAGEDVSFHIPLKGILGLVARDIEFVPEDPVPRWRTVTELGLARRAPFYPPLEQVFFTLKPSVTFNDQGEVFVCPELAKELNKPGNEELRELLLSMGKQGSAIERRKLREAGAQGTSTDRRSQTP